MEDKEFNSMIDIFLTLIVIAVIIHHGYESYLHKQEKDKLLNALIAKNANEMTNLTLADQTKVIAEKPQGQSDLIPTDEMDQDLFDKMIDNENRVVDETSEV